MTYAFRFFYLCMVAVFILGMSTAKAAFPEKPVTIVVGYAAGGPADFMARTVAEGLGELWGQPVVVENKPGATATIAAAYVARARPDGYTLLLAANDYVTSKFTHKDLSYEVGKSFVPIGMISSTPNTLMVVQDAPFQDFESLLSAVKDNPDKFNYSSTGLGSTSHVAAELFKSRTGTKIRHIPYNGVAQAVPDILSGEIDMVFPSLSSFKSQVDSGNFRALAQATEERTSLLPDVPTFEELGVEGFVVNTWYGVIGPEGMEPSLVDKINHDLNMVLEETTIQEALLIAGSEAMPISPQEFEVIIKRDSTTMEGLLDQLDLG